ncbi:hypothetical protein SLEP1_g33900 [Rubroshorea leprosula]|uniref:Uncharacterized protein n=1 Tax=Rubroshorea leprosula TaxID=152421 RepID=A0AAV5KIC0_9ROSI|nr:hypothetical protein SLEP1_g33900 [Rubroshorea leprosula]
MPEEIEFSPCFPVLRCWSSSSMIFGPHLATSQW